MLKLRVAAAATVIALIGAFASMGTANAATNGVGTTEASTSLIDVALGSAGSLLHVRVLGDDAKATVDPAVGPVSAVSDMFALKITSSVLPGLSNISLPNPPFHTAAPGGPTSATGSVNLGSGVPSLPLLGTAIASGALTPQTMTSSIDNGIAKSTINSKLLSANLVGGLLSVDSVDSTLAAAAAGQSSDGTRSLKVNGISVLNLGALLKGLGIDPANLPVTNVSSLLDTLDVTLADVPAGQTLGTFVTTLNSTISSLTAASGTFGGLTAPLQGTLNGLGLPVAGGATAIPSATSVTSVLGDVTDLLDSVLTTALGALDGIKLLELDGIEVGTATKAVSNVKDSTYGVIAKIGTVKVGGIALPGIDLASTLGTVTGLVNSITSTLDGALGTLGLSGLIDVQFFDKASTNGVSTQNGYVRSLAGITGLGVSITPPANLAGIIQGLLPAAGIGNAITGAGGTIPVVGGLMSTLNGASGLPAVGGVVGALAGGASIKVASLTTGSNFKAPTSTPISTPTLPRTGANTTAFLVIGMLMVGGVIVARRFHMVKVSE